MYILGISAYYHDSAAALIKDGKIVAAAQEERFSRKKQDPGFPVLSIKFCLDYAGIDISQVEIFSFYDKPFVKFERLLETYYVFSPKGLMSFIKAMPVWLKEKLFLKDTLKKELRALCPPGVSKIPRIHFSEHHLSHAASAYYPSPFEDAAILTIDGVGEWATSTICHGQGASITSMKEMNFPHSWGLLYSAFTYYLGFKVNSGEYKLMGLAPYGNPNDAETHRFIKLIKDHLIDLKSDGSVWLNLEYFSFPVGLSMCKDKKWEKLFGIAKRPAESELTASQMNLAFAIQKVTEEGVLNMVREAKKITKSNNLVLAGGVALNCVANGKIVEEKIFDNVWIQPAAGDAGGALGAALVSWHIEQGQPLLPIKDNEMDKMAGSYLGPEYDHVEIEKTIRKFQLVYSKVASMEDVYTNTAEELASGHVVGWFQDRMEWGPRSLGNRSILADARNEEMQKKLNLKIKYRESFRPFAPSILAERNHEFFSLESDSPYMLLVSDVVKSRCNKVPESFDSMSLKDKLYFVRSDVPSITHLDFSARVQTVHKETNIKYWSLINKFGEKTGYPLVVNTSFNVRGEPIVCTPEDAVKCFLRTEMDTLVIQNYMFFKKDQKVKIDDSESWKEEYPLD